MKCIGGALHRRPPMHALYALSQDAPAGRGCAEEMCYRNRTRPQDGRRRVPTREKNRLTMLGCWAKRMEKTPYDDPRVAGGASGGAEPWAPGWPWSPRGQGPGQGAQSSYNAPRGGGPGPCGHSPDARGRGPWAIGSRGGGAVDARPAPGEQPRPRSPPGSQSAYNAGWNPVPVV